MKLTIKKWNMKIIMLFFKLYVKPGIRVYHNFDCGWGNITPFHKVESFVGTCVYIEEWDGIDTILLDFNKYQAIRLTLGNVLKFCKGGIEIKQPWEWIVKRKHEFLYYRLERLK